MIPRTIAKSSGRSTPAMPRQIAAGATSTPAERFLHDVVQDLLDLELSNGLQIGAAAARGRRRSVPSSSASRQTVFVPPASMPRTLDA